jgi:hypothetical protein
MSVVALHTPSPDTSSTCTASKIYGDRCYKTSYNMLTWISCVLAAAALLAAAAAPPGSP